MAFVIGKICVLADRACTKLASNSVTFTFFGKLSSTVEKLTILLPRYEVSQQVLCLERD
jgi:hypothetical protein